MSAWAPEVAETHSAWVVMLGERAYKVKKPVALGFLDFTTREARERAVHREVELNRRLAPDVYLGVADVVGPGGELWDHMVVMRRMPAARRLATLVEGHDPLDDEVRRIARVVAAFHAGAERSPAVSSAGAPDAVRAKVERDLEELGAFAGTVLDEALLAEVSGLVRRYLVGRSRLLEDRVDRGHVVDGHGDLLAGDIFCLEDGPRILDCIEFDDGLRHGDVLADIAFLAMDLERLGAPDLAGVLVAAYEEFSGEHHPQSLADYYVAARALIRSKVACIRSADDDGASATEARALLDLAARHLRGAQVRLVLVGGVPGSGKSTLAEGIADRLECFVLRSDGMRKDLLGLGHAARAEAPYGEGAYDAVATEATYRGLLDRAREALTLGESVILDASWSDAARRAAAARVAEEACADLVELRCEVPAEVSVTRIAERRARGGDVSDATPEIAAAMRAVFDPWPTAHVISTAGDERESLSSALLALGG